ncbi:hypothetical protein LSTR_LSTR015024 [Laodelphax striatellus]|uniref:Uncharacterized protein n=1 Tax=Laodelphax striatellus TaxID=195883 RepID=A0A482WMW4_LAOST|nr:hypothetical protein LSTR_LSTR015024 [Laodelphax striatellus]
MIVRGIMSLNWIVYDVGKASSTESGLSSLRIWLSGGRPALLSRRAYLGRILFLKPPSALPLPTILVTLSHPIRAGQPETSLRHTGSLTVVARSVYGQPGPGLGHCYAMGMKSLRAHQVHLLCALITLFHSSTQPLSPPFH